MKKEDYDKQTEIKKGKAYLEQNKGLLDAQWEYIEWLGHLEDIHPDKNRDDLIFSVPPAVPLSGEKQALRDADTNIKKVEMKIVLQSVIICPVCGYSKEETMPEDACAFFYECENCRKVLKPKPGDCCVYCSYGTVKCPPVQQGAGCCG